MSSGNNNNNDGDLELEDITYVAKGGRITTVPNEELLQITITQVTIYNESEESLSLGDIDIYSIIIVEEGSTIKYIGI